MEHLTVYLHSGSIIITNCGGWDYVPHCLTDMKMRLRERAVTCSRHSSCWTMILGSLWAWLQSLCWQPLYSAASQGTRALKSSFQAYNGYRASYYFLKLWEMAGQEEELGILGGSRVVRKPTPELPLTDQWDQAGRIFSYLWFSCIYPSKIPRESVFSPKIIYQKIILD